MVKHLLTALLCIVLWNPLVAAEDVAINRVFIKYREAQDFRTIRAYFSNGTYNTRRCIMRSQEESWDGVYFIAEMEDLVRSLPADSRLKLEVITPFDPMPRSYMFDIPEHRKTTWELHAGLTGSDWPDAEARPLAWKLSVIDSADKELATFKSFLWE